MPLNYLFPFRRKHIAFGVAFGEETHRRREPPVPVSVTLAMSGRNPRALRRAAPRHRAGAGRDRRAAAFRLPRGSRRARPEGAGPPPSLRASRSSAAGGCCRPGVAVGRPRRKIVLSASFQGKQGDFGPCAQPHGICNISRAVVDIKCVAARVVASAPVFVDPFRGRPSATPGPDFQLHRMHVPRERQIAVAGLDDLFPELRDMYEGDVVERIRNSGVSLAFRFPAGRGRGAGAAVRGRTKGPSARCCRRRAAGRRSCPPARSTPSPAGARPPRPPRPPGNAANP